MEARVKAKPCLQDVDAGRKFIGRVSPDRALISEPGMVPVGCPSPHRRCALLPVNRLCNRLFPAEAFARRASIPASMWIVFISVE
ncbi:MAG: hypothetical protein C4576_04245 [Desulfobacteraceae bacterium]|nr:MAG: hypothetical protein C4576_04245 [Desulfobacteraceae bacterium]